MKTTCPSGGTGDPPVGPGDPPGPFTSTEYDLAGGVTTQIDERCNRTEFTYDAAGRQSKMKNALGHITQSVYDAAGRETADEYDLAGNRRKMQTFLNAFSSPGGEGRVRASLSVKPLSLSMP